MKHSKSTMFVGAILFGLSMCFTSCEDILGTWDKPTPTNVTPSGGGDDGGGSTPSAYTMAKDATSTDKGKLICADGHIHANGADAACTKARVAIITYVGSDAETSTTYNHGLALALSDVSSTQTWCSQISNTCLTTQYSSASDAKGDMAGLANTDALVGHGSHTHAAANAARNYNSGTHPTGTSAWFLPSAGQWDKMATAAGGYNNLGLQSYVYWSSSESGANYAWGYDSGNGIWGGGDKKISYVVRACLAF